MGKPLGCEVKIMNKEILLIIEKQRDFGLDDLDVGEEEQQVQEEILENNKFTNDKFLKACFTTWD